jgi:tRNA A37 N6-isopentenylltransferase MiaA
MLAGRLRPDALRDAIVVATRRYAKRQETWFRHQLREAGGGRGEGGGVWTLDATESPTALAERIVARWQAVTRPAARLPQRGAAR